MFKPKINVSQLVNFQNSLALWRQGQYFATSQNLVGLLQMNKKDFLKTLEKCSNPIDDIASLGDLEPPMDEGMEVWAAGVTYKRR